MPWAVRLGFRFLLYNPQASRPISRLTEADRQPLPWSRMAGVLSPLCSTLPLTVHTLRATAIVACAHQACSQS
jgi:hypothetical protein